MRKRRLTALLVCLPPALLMGFLLLGNAQEQQPQPARYLGVRGCRDCHGTRSSGDQYGIWLKNKHSTAYKTLLTPKANELAAGHGFDNPVTSEFCLKCHITGAGQPADRFMPSFSKEEGVGCEACHGPGSIYYLRDVMDDRNEVYKQGLVKPEERVCIDCHNTISPCFKEFKFAEAVEKIKHPLPANGIVDAGGIVWLDSFEKGIKAAREKKMPIMVSFFYSKACPISEALAPTLSHPDVVQESRSFACVRYLDKPSSVHIGFGYQDAAIVFFSPEGTEVKGMYGDYPPELLVHMMRRVRRVIEIQSEMQSGIEPAEAGGELTGRSLLAELDKHAATCHAHESHMREFLAKILEAGEAGERALGETIWVAPLRQPITMQLAVEVLRSPGRKGGENLLLDIMSFLYDPSPFARHCAATALGMLGDKQIAPYIAKYLLADGDERVVAAAFRALRQIKDPSCAERLLAVIESPSCCYLPLCPARIEAVAAFYGIADISFAEKLIEFARRDSFVSRAVLAALGEAGARTAKDGAADDPRLRRIVSYLLQVVEDRQQAFDLRNEALYSLGKIGINFVVADDASARCPTVFGICSPGQPIPEGAQSLGLRLTQRLAEPNAELRATFYEMMGQIRAFETVPILIETIERDESEIPRAYAGQALADLLLADSNASLEDAAPDTGKEGDEKREKLVLEPGLRARALAALDMMTGAGSQLERSLAAESLARLGDTSYIAGLREAVAANAGTRPEDRKALAIACRALAASGLKSAVPAIVEMLSPRDMDTTRHASLALQELVGPDVVPFGGEVPLDPPRLIFACDNAPSVAEERRWILGRAAATITPWRRWLAVQGEKFMADLEKMPATPAKKEDASSIAALEVEVVELSAGPLPDEAGKEYHVWLKLTFRDGVGQPVKARGLVELLEPDRSADSTAPERKWWEYEEAKEKPKPTTEVTEPSAAGGTTKSQNISRKPPCGWVINHRCWLPVSHESPDWIRGAGMENLGCGMAHSNGGSLFLHLKSGFLEQEAERNSKKKLVVRFSAKNRPMEATVEVPR
jgi:HEAT repeat protein